MTKISNKEILIVDDDVEYRDYLAGVLGTCYRLRFADNGDEGLEVARRARPDLILLDVMMPGGRDGLQVLAELKNDPATREIPVIMLTAVNAALSLSFDKDIVGAYLGAPAAFIDKPVPAATLLDAVSAALKASAS